MLFSDLFLFFPEVWEKVGKEYLTEWSKPALRSGRDLVVSSEGIFGGLVTPRPWYKRRLEWMMDEVNVLRAPNGFPSHASSATHLQAVSDAAADVGFDQTKILITVRRQDTKLASGYAEMSSSIAGASQDNFEKWITKLVDDPVGRYALGGKKLDYASWWKQVSTEMGPENILLLPMELLGADQSEFLGRWLDFLELQSLRAKYIPFDEEESSKKRVSSVSDRVWSLRPPVRSIQTLPFRILRKAGLRSVMKRWFSVPKREERIRLTDEMSEKILTFYEESNRELDSQINSIDLQGHGYY